MLDGMKPCKLLDCNALRNAAPISHASGRMHQVQGTYIDNTDEGLDEEQVMPNHWSAHGSPRSQLVLRVQFEPLVDLNRSVSASTANTPTPWIIALVSMAIMKLPLSLCQDVLSYDGVDGRVPETSSSTTHTTAGSAIRGRARVIAVD
jgi:hypothetical protein